ncbi:hypothetical protein A2U01_0088518, partial [Trifolium medium]|nr:hypothetical protein [Trifolium medium]
MGAGRAYELDIACCARRRFMGAEHAYELEHCLLRKLMGAGLAYELGRF